MMKCKDCKYWKVTEDYKNFGVCESGLFEDISDYSSKPYDYEDNTVIFSDFEGCKAFLWTGQNFGCIHFKHRE